MGSEFIVLKQEVCMDVGSYDIGNICGIRTFYKTTLCSKNVLPPGLKLDLKISSFFPLAMPF